MFIAGYDPGGVKNNGIALLEISEEWKTLVFTDTCDCVDEALEWIIKQVKPTYIDAIGIDSPLSWATVPCGWRPMDKKLRHNYKKVSNSIVSSNSAFGSMTVQGMALALRLIQIRPVIRLNETHPKVQYYSLNQEPYNFKEPGNSMNDWLGNQFTPKLKLELKNDHEWDAIFSAWATWMGLIGAWSTDLMTLAKDLLLPAGKVTYYWPESLKVNTI